MMPSPPSSHPHSPAAAALSPAQRGSADEPPPVPPLRPHLLGPRPTSSSHASSSCPANKPSPSCSVELDPDRWRSYALTLDPSGDSLDAARSGGQQQAGFSSAGSSSNSSTGSRSDGGGGSSSSSRTRSPELVVRSRPRSRGRQDGGQADADAEGGLELLASPFLGPADMLTPPFEMSEDEATVRRRGLGVDLGLPAPAKPTLLGGLIAHRPTPAATDDRALFPLSPPSSDAPRQSLTTPPSPRTPPTPFLRTVSSHTFTSTTTTTTTTTGTRGVDTLTPLLPSGYVMPSAGGLQGSASDGAPRPRTVSTSVLDGESPRKRVSRPASVRDWQSDDDDGFEPTVGTAASRNANARRRAQHHHHSSRTTPTGSTRSPSSPFTAADVPLPSTSAYRSGTGSSSRQQKFKPTRSAPDSRTNLVGMLSAALNMSPSTAIATLSSSLDPPPAMYPTTPAATDNDDDPLPAAAAAAALALTGPLPALSKAITAPIAPLAHVFAFVLISLAAAVALSTVLVGSYGLTAWDVTRTRVSGARATLEDGRRRFGASVERGRKLIEGAVDGARELAEGLVDSASAGLEDGDGDSSRSTSDRHARSRTASGQSASSTSASSSPRKAARPSASAAADRAPRSSLVGSAATTVDDMLNSLADGFWKVMKRVVPAATVKRVLEAAEVRLGKRPAPPPKDKGRCQQQQRSKASGVAHASRGKRSASSAGSHQRYPSDELSTPDPSAPAEHPSPYESRFTFASGASSSTARSPRLGTSSSSASDDEFAPPPPKPRPKRASSLPPRPPLSVLVPSIILTLVIAFGAMAYNLLKKRAPAPSMAASSSTSGTASPSSPRSRTNPALKTKRPRPA